MDRRRGDGPDILSNQVCLLLRLSANHSMTNSAWKRFLLNFLPGVARTASAETAAANRRVSRFRSFDTSRQVTGMAGAEPAEHFRIGHIRKKFDVAVSEEHRRSSAGGVAESA